jgi:hypothetical protein
VTACHAWAPTPRFHVRPVPQAQQGNLLQLAGLPFHRQSKLPTPPPQFRAPTLSAPPPLRIGHGEAGFPPSSGHPNRIQSP